MVQVLLIYPGVTDCSPVADVAEPLTVPAKTSIPRLSWVGFPRNGWFVKTVASEKANMLRKTRQSGQALIAVAFGLVVLLGAAGLAVDMGYLRYQKRLEQSAADSAALAGATERAFGGNFDLAAKTDSGSNGFADGVNNVTVTVTPTTYNGNPNAVQVQVAAVQPIFFMKVFGLANPTVTANATAVFKGGQNCIYSLNGDLQNSHTLDVPNCGIVSNDEVINTGGHHITAESVGAVNGPPPPGTTPNAVTGIAPAADPLAYLQPPAAGGCLSGVVSDTVPTPTTMNPVTLPAGTYCNGITVSGIRSVNFSGTYVVTGNGTSGNAVSFGGTGTVSGNGVTIYLNGSATGGVMLSPSQTFNLVAPTTDPYAGILFYQDKTNPAPATINGTGGSKFQGAFYFPGALLTVDRGGSGAAYMIFVANSLTLASPMNFPSNYSSLANGSPIKDAVLVE